jgi:ankyrin repeat protein
VRNRIGFLGGIAMLCALAGCVPRPATGLQRAAAAGNAEEVRRLLSSGTKVDDEAPGAFTALVWAARQGSPETVKLLLDAGSDPSRRAGVNGWTSLQHAVHKGRADNVAMLLGSRSFAAADRNEALVMAAGYGSAPMVRLLLASGADPKGDRALRNAVGGAHDIDWSYQGCTAHTEVVKELLAAAPDLTLSDDPADRRALDYAKGQGCSEMVALLARK